MSTASTPTEVASSPSTGPTADSSTSTTVVATSTTEFVYQADPILAELPTMFATYGALISAGREGEAYDRFAGPELVRRISRDDFIEGNATSTLHDTIVYDAFWLDVDHTSAEAWVTFISFQDASLGPEGQTCSIWDLTYTLVRADDAWRIQSATNEPDSPAAC